MKTANTPWGIEINTTQMVNPLKILLEDQLIIGQSIPSDDQPPDIDLSPFGAAELEVDHHHLVIFTQDNQLYAKDLGSKKGSVLNGTPLVPNQPYPLENHNALELGEMALEIHLIISPMPGSGVYKNALVEIDDQIYHGAGERILIVEDDPEISKIFALIMERLGYKTTVTHEVVSAIRSFNRSHPDAIILDLMLPDMNGLEFCRYVRRDEKRNDLPVIVVSAHPSPDSVKDSMRAGADVFLQKPVSTRELQQVVTSLIHQYRGGKPTVHTKQLVGTAPLQKMPLEKRRQSVVLFVAGYGDAPIILNVRDKLSFGRRLEMGNQDAHMDLSPYEAVEMGVSRQHMFLYKKENGFFIEDANSTNGTYLNDVKIKPGELVQVHNGDQVHLGGLCVFIYFTEFGTEEMSQQED